MGNKTNTPASTSSSEVEFINHPKFKEVHLVDLKGEKYIELKAPVHSQKEVKNWEKALQDIKNLNKEALLLPHSHTFQKEGLCGTTGIVNILYENYPYLLSDEIHNRSTMKRHFEEGEIWYLLFTAVGAAKDFEQRNTKLGDIRPQNIFINDGGQIKLANIYSWPSEEINYFKSLLNREDTFLAPEEMKELQIGKNDPASDPTTAEAFSIGLTILDAAMLSDSSSLYNFKSNKFDTDRARQSFQEWERTNYSDYLKQTVLSLLDLEPKNRKRASQIYQQLLPYEDDINNLRDFTSTMPRTIVHSSVVPEFAKAGSPPKLGQAVPTSIAPVGLPNGISSFPTSVGGTNHPTHTHTQSSLPTVVTFNPNPQTFYGSLPPVGSTFASNPIPIPSHNFALYQPAPFPSSQLGHFPTVTQTINTQMQPATQHGTEQKTQETDASKQQTLTNIQGNTILSPPPVQVQYHQQRIIPGQPLTTYSPYIPQPGSHIPVYFNSGIPHSTTQFTSGQHIISGPSFPLTNTGLPSYTLPPTTINSGLHGHSPLYPGATGTSSTYYSSGITDIGRLGGISSYVPSQIGGTSLLNNPIGGLTSTTFTTTTTTQQNATTTGQQQQQDGEGKSPEPQKTEEKPAEEVSRKQLNDARNVNSAYPLAQ